MNISPTERRADKGFTLIELMVVVLIIAILLAIAIPTFLGAQNKAKDRSAQSSARNALTNAKTLYADGGSYFVASVASLSTSEPSLTFVDGTLVGIAASSSGPKSVSVLGSGSATVPGTVWYGAVLSDTGTCFFVFDSVASTGGGTKYGKAPGTNATCIASATAPAGGWLANW